MKKSKQCPKCDSLRVGCLETIFDRYPSETIHGRNLGFTVEGTQGVGRLEGYVCADCGYLETYVTTPASVPWDTLRKFHWLNSEPPDTPYR